MGFTGPTAISLFVLGIVGAIAPMIFHGEIPHYVGTLVRVFLASGTVSGAVWFGSLIGAGGALV
jgi:hypothetical protein